MEKTTRDRLYELATVEEDARLCRDISEDQCREQPHNFVRQTIALALSKCGDALADSKTVLPWLLGAVGAPVFLIGLLTPIREALALIPQLLVGGIIRRYAIRKWFWTGASFVEGLSILAMAVVASAGLSGTSAGWSIVGLLILFSTARGVASVASKDTLGKTISKGKRGRVNGHASTIAGVVATFAGISLALSPEAARPDWLLYVMIGAAGLCWIVAGLSFAATVEYSGATDGGRSIRDMAVSQFKLILSEKELRKFLLARGFLISTALMGPVYVALALQQDHISLEWLGWLVVSSGAASATSASIWGFFSDQTSRATMAVAALIASIAGFATLFLAFLIPGVVGQVWFYIGIFYVLGVAHAGVRIGRKTQLIDLAGKDDKAAYTAVSNTIIGVLLILIGIFVTVLMSIDLMATVLTLSLLSLIGSLLSMQMKNAQA